MKRLLPLIALAAALVGCGGSATPGSGGNGAAAVPADVAAYVSIDTDLSSSQWKTVDSLLGKFPSKDKLLAQLRTSFENSSKVSWEQDVKPALGNELDVAVLDLSADTNAVALTQPKDQGKFDALVKKLNASDTSGSKAVTEKVDGWTVLADSQAKLDAFKQASGGAKLADDQSFKDAIGGLDKDALAKVYVNGAKVTQKLQGMLGGANGNAMLQGLSRLQTGAAQLVAQDNGFLLSGSARSSGKAAAVADYKTTFIGQVPAGALVYLTFHGNAKNQNPTKGLQAIPQMQQLAPILGAVGRLGPVLAGENALYVLPGSPIPEVTLLAQPKSAAQGTAAVDRLVASFAPQLGGAAAKPTTLDGVAAKVLNLGRFSVYYGTFGGRLFVSSSQRVVSELRSGGQKLKDDPTFKEAKQAAGLPDSSAGFVYVNLKDAVPFIESVAQLGGSRIPPDIDANLRHLSTLLVFGSAKTNEARFAAFVGIK